MSNVGDLRIQISADLGTAERALNKLKADAQAAGDAGARGLSRLEGSIEGVNQAANTNALSRYERQLRQIQQSTSGLEASFNRASGGVARLAAQLGGVYAAQRGARSFIEMSDQAVRLEGRLKLVTASTEELTSVQRQLFEISQRTRSEYGSNVELYTRSSQALKQLGATSGQTLQLVESLNQAFQISGATGSEASSAIIQLSQAFASGVLRGEEFNSISEQGPRILQALADALGKTRGELRAMAEQGQLTSKLVFDALLNQAPKIASEFATVPRTVGQAMMQLGNQMLKTVGETNNATQSTAKLVEQVDRLRDIVATTDFASALAFMARGVTNVIEDIVRAQRAISNTGEVVRNTLKGWYNAFVDIWADIVEVSLNAVNEIVISVSDTINRINRLGYVKIPNPFASLDFDAAGAGARIREGKIAIDEFKNAADRLGANTPSVNGLNGISAALAAQKAELEGTTGATSDFTYELGQSAAEAEKAAEKFAKAQLARMRGYDDAVTALQREIATFGMSEGAVAQLTFRYEALTAAKRAAEDANRAVSPEEIAAINSAASQVGTLTDQLKALNEQKQQFDRVSDFQNDLLFRQQQLGRTEVERSVAQALRSVGLEYGNAANAGIEAQVRYIEQLEAVKTETMDIGKITADSFQEIVEAIGNGENAIDSFIGGLARLGQEFARQGLQKAFGNLFPQNAGSNLPVNGNIQAGGGASPYYSGTPMAAQSQNLRAMNDNLAASVTQTVSNNLLGSMLGAGKDPQHIRGLNADFASSLTSMFEAAPEAIRASVTINSGFRSVARQAELFEAALKKYGSEAAARKWVAPPGRSNHNRGMAVDLGYGNNAAREWVHQNAGRFGLQFPMSHENWHIEPINARGGGQMRQAVAGGVLDAQRTLASGNVSASIPIPSARPQGGMQSGGAANALSGVRNFLQSPMGQTGMAGVTAFAGGMQSGSPMGGALNGGLAAFGMGLGPVGMAVGAVGGLLGGLFGRSKRKREERRQRQEQERQQQMQAQQQLAQQLPAILELQDTLLDRASGTLQKEKARIESQLKQYRELAAQAKDQGEIARLQSMTDALDDYMNRLYDQVRLTAGSIINSLNQGRGLEPAFAKAAADMREMSLALRNYIADLIAAVGETSELVGQARAASREQLLRQLSGPQEVSEIYTKLDTLAGTAAGLGTELQKLGLNAEQAANAIRDHLNRGIQKMRDDFVKGIAGEIIDAQGYGYAGQIQSLIERRNTMRADAVSLGADPALIDRWFKVQVQSIVDQSGLLDDSLKTLTEAFPELNGVLRATKKAVNETFADAQEALRTSYNHVKQFASSLTDFRNNILLDGSRTILSPLDRLTEAQNQFKDVSQRAAAGDAEAQNKLIGVSQAYLDEAKSYYASSEGYFKIFGEVDSVLKSSETVAKAELATAEAQYNALLTLNNSILTIPQALAEMNNAQAARDLAQAQALQSYVQALNPQAAIPSYQAPQAPTPIAPASSAGPQYEYLDGRMGNWKTHYGLRVFQRAGEDIDTAYMRHFNLQHFGNETGATGPTENTGYGSAYWASNQKRFGGAIGTGYAGLTGFQNGGMIANGIWDRDSVVARHANGGAVALAGGEFVTRAPSVNTETRSMLDFINKNGSLPRMTSNDNRLEGVERRLDRLTQAVAFGFQSSIGAVERGNKIAESQGDNMQLMASR